MRSPDRWAKETGRRSGGTPAWWEQIPTDVKRLVAASSLGAAGLADWFRTEVAEAYPDEEWPKEATRHKCERLIEAVRNAAA